MGVGSLSSGLMGGNKILVAFFSHSGNTCEIANQIHKSVGGDIFEIQAVKPYPNDYDAVVEQAKQELDSDYKPALKTKIENIKSGILPIGLLALTWPSSIATTARRSRTPASSSSAK